MKNKKQSLNNFRFLALSAALVALVSTLLCVPAAFADNVYASIRGVVTDPSGASVANATLTAVNADTGIVTKATSSADGIYVFPQLTIGTYTVNATAQRFKTFQTSQPVEPKQLFDQRYRFQRPALEHGIDYSQRGCTSRIQYHHQHYQSGIWA